MTHKILTPKKRLGQHFLQSSFYAKRIANAVPSSDDSKVVEIGPGCGALSIFLKGRFPRFHCIETDTEIIPCLRERLGDGRWTLHQGNVLDFNFSELGAPLHIVGNLPYNIGSVIIKKTLLCAPQVASVTYMVQREVAERIVAKPHTKKIGFLSIFCQFFGMPRILFKVPSGAFFPKPKVDSAVFQLPVAHALCDRLPRHAWEDFFLFVSRSYTMRRKTLAAGLAWKTDKKEVYQKILTAIGLSSDVRPEDLDVQNWIELFTRVKGVDS